MFPGINGINRFVCIFNKLSLGFVHFLNTIVSLLSEQYYTQELMDCFTSVRVSTLDSVISLKVRQKHTRRKQPWINNNIPSWKSDSGAETEEITSQST